MEIIEFVQRNYRLLVAHPWEFAAIAALAAGAGFWVAEYHYSGRIDQLMETLQTKEFPKPTVQYVAKPVPDQERAKTITKLREQVAADAVALKALGASPASVGSVGGSGNVVSVGQQGGITAKAVNLFAGRQERRLTPEITARLLRAMPPKTQEIHTICAMNDAEACKLLDEVENMLSHHGYKITNRSEGVDPDFLIASFLIHTVTDESGKHTKIAVGPNQ